MDKPISVVCEDFKQDMANLINGSGLPLFIIEMVLQNYLNETRNIAIRQYQNDKAKYEESLKTKEK